MQTWVCNGPKGGIHLALLVAAVAFGGCGGGNGSDGSGDDGGASGQAGSTAQAGGPSGGGGVETFPDGSRRYGRVVNLVGEDLAAELDRCLSGEDEKLDLTVRRFYSLFGDDYDFLVMVADHDNGSTTVGRSWRARFAATIGTGIDYPYVCPDYGNLQRLKLVAGVQYNGPDVMPPIGHELMHTWANYLDPSLGFGHDAEKDYDLHWGMTSVHGILGGFDAATLRCTNPAGEVPPNCTPEADGHFRYQTSRFWPNDNGGLRAPFGPLELYLMGLLPAAEVPERFTVLENALLDKDSIDNEANTVVVDADGTSEIAFQDIVARHGQRALVPESERHFTGAFVVVSAEPASEEVLQAATVMSEVLGAEREVEQGWLSFSDMTGGRATLDTNLGPTGGVVGLDEPAQWDLCQPVTQDCGEGYGCYGYAQTGAVCSIAGTLAEGQPCSDASDCAPGMGCIGVVEQQGTYRCSPYCEYPGDGERACSNICVGSYRVMVSDSEEILFAFCDPVSPG